MPINTSPSSGFLQQSRPMGMMQKQPGQRAGFRPPTFGMGRTRPRTPGTGGIDPMPPGMGGGATNPGGMERPPIMGYRPPDMNAIKRPFPGINTSPGGPTDRIGLPPGMNSTMPIDPNMSPIQKQPFPINTGPQLKPGAGGMPAPWMPPIRDDMGPGSVGPGTMLPPNFGGMQMDRSDVMPQMSTTALPSGMGMGVPAINGQDPLRRYF